MGHDYRGTRDAVFGIRREGQKVIGYTRTTASIKERALLLALVEFAPNIEPSTASLALMLGTSEREVRRLLRSAEAKGLLQVVLRLGHRSRYVLTVDPGHSVPPQEVQDDVEPRTQCPPTPDTVSSPPRTGCPPKRTSKADKEADKRESAREPGTASPSSKPARRRKAKAPEIPLPEDFKPTAKHEAYAAKHGLALQFEVDGMRGWAEGKTAVSWNGVLTTRLANRARWDAEDRAKGNGTRKGPVAQRGVHEGVNMEGANSHLYDEPEQAQLPMAGGGE